MATNWSVVGTPPWPISRPATLWSYASCMSVMRPSIVAVAGGKFQRAHGMSFCGGSANVPTFSDVTGLSAANAAAVGGLPGVAPGGGPVGTPPHAPTVSPLFQALLRLRD